MTTKIWQGFWRLADPKIALASFAGLFLGAAFAFAASAQSLDWFWLALTVIGIFCVEVAKNASGEIVDYDSGTDLAVSDAQHSPFSGGKRVLVDKLLSRQQTWVIAGVFYTLAILIGLSIVIYREPQVLTLGLAGIALAWFYHGGAVKLSYRGLGEVAVALAYGPLVVCGTYLVQTGHVTGPVIHCAIALGIQVSAFLWINEFPDFQADCKAGKHNLVVRMGLSKAASGYWILVVSGYLWLALTAWHYPVAVGVMWGWLAFPLGAFSAWRLFAEYANTPKLIPAQIASLGNFTLMALFAGVGVMLGS